MLGAWLLEVFRDFRELGARHHFCYKGQPLLTELPNFTSFTPPMPFFLALLWQTLFAAQTLSNAAYPTHDVRVFGALSDIMMGGKLSASVALDTLSTKGIRFGLGVAEGLDGEITIVDGLAYTSRVRKGKITLERGYTGKAAFLATTTDSLLTAITSPGPCGTYDLPGKVERIAGNAMGLNVKERPFFFRILAPAAQVQASYHVMAWPKNKSHEGVGHGPEHTKYAVRDSLLLGEVQLVGVYAPKLQGTAVRKGEKLHLHLYDPGTGRSAHVDKVYFPNGFTICLPAR